MMLDVGKSLNPVIFIAVSSVHMIFAKLDIDDGVCADWP